MNVNRSSMLTANLHNNKERSLNSLLISNASLKRKPRWVKIQLYRTKYLENQSKNYQLLDMFSLAFILCLQGFYTNSKCNLYQVQSILCLFCLIMVQRVFSRNTTIRTQVEIKLIRCDNFKN